MAKRIKRDGLILGIGLLIGLILGIWLAWPAPPRTHVHDVREQVKTMDADTDALLAEIEKEMGR